MATCAPIEILDLRHFAALGLRPVLEAETDVWKQRLHWDYRTSIKLLSQYLDSRMLPGYAAIESGQVVGYAFCVYEETKAVIGDVFALSCAPDGASSPLRRGTAAGRETAPSAHEIEETLLKHLLETLLHSPQTARVESQLLLHPSGTHAERFLNAGFEIFHRLFLVQPLDGHWSQPRFDLPAELELRSWRDEDLLPAARLICEAYRDHADGLINDQYRSVYGSQRFLANIVRYSGCGAFSAPVSHVILHRPSREFVALLLGSRVSPESGHITQICVHPRYRRRGLARNLLSLAAFQFLRLGAREISLTVTEANTDAIGLYRTEGYECAHRFDAAVWERRRSGSRRNALGQNQDSDTQHW